MVVPTKLRQKVLNDLHRDHVDVVRMKAIARSYMRWPGMDADIENLAKFMCPAKLLRVLQVKHQCIPGCAQSSLGDGSMWI